jgi:hypothetical protein
MEPASAWWLVSVAAWPRGWGEAERLAALAESVGMMPSDARLALRHEPPIMVAWLEEPAAKDSVRVLRGRGVPALAIGPDAWSALGERFRAKRLVKAEGAPSAMYLVEPWLGRLEPIGLLMRDVRLIVRGRLAPAERADAGVDDHDGPWSGPVDVSWGALPWASTGEGALAAALAGDGLDESAGSGPGPVGLGGSRRTALAGEVLDLYRDDQPPVRIDGRKFGFDVLGRDRSLTDSENIDRLALRLAEEAPGAQVDLGFAGFAPPPGVRRAWRPRDRGAGASLIAETRAFDLYSAWKAILDRAVRRSRAKGDARGGR